MLVRPRRLLAHPQAWPALAGLALGLLALGPALRPGYVLSYDMVFGPHPPITAATLGLAGGPPLAVPSDAVIAALAAVVPADLVQKIILVAIFTACCTGAAGLLAQCAARTGRTAGLLPRLAAGVFYAWNPLTAERLILGQWALLLGYAGLPWVVRAVRADGRPLRPAGLGRLGAALVPATVGGFAAVGITALAAVPVAIATASGRRPRGHTPPNTHHQPREHPPGPAGRAAPAAGAEQAGAADTEQAGAADTEQAGAADTEQAGAAGAKQVRPAGAKQARAADTEQAGAADTEQVRPAGAKQARAADTEQARAADTEQARAAGSEQARAADTEQARAAGSVRARAARLGVVLGALGVACLPWLIPALVVGVHTDPGGANAFAARPDTPFGAAGSLLLLGGVWNAQVVPRGYGGGAAVIWLLVVGVAVAGYAWLGGRARACPGLGAAGLAGFAVAALGTTALTRGVLRDLIAAWPGFAVLRDGQQFVAPLALTEAVGIGLVAAWLTTELSGQMMPEPAGNTGTAPGRPGGPRRTAAGRASIALAIMAAIAPVLLLPGLAWGAAGRLHAVSYPASWLRARRLIDADPRPGAVALFPWASYRRYGWNERGAVLDPWPKLLSRRVLWNEALQVGAQTVASGDPATWRLARAVAAPGALTVALRSAGVRYVIVDAGPLLRRDRQQPGGCLAQRARLPGATVVLASGSLAVFRLGLAAAAGPAGPADSAGAAASAIDPAKRLICAASGR
jgi:hypothetical protein